MKIIFLIIALLAQGFLSASEAIPGLGRSGKELTAHLCFYAFNESMREIKRREDEEWDRVEFLRRQINCGERKYIGECEAIEEKFINTYRFPTEVIKSFETFYKSMPMPNIDWKVDTAQRDFTYAASVVPPQKTFIAPPHTTFTRLLFMGYWMIVRTLWLRQMRRLSCLQAQFGVKKAFFPLNADASEVVYRTEYSFFEFYAKLFLWLEMGVLKGASFGTLDTKEQSVTQELWIFAEDLRDVHKSLEKSIGHELKPYDDMVKELIIADGVVRGLSREASTPESLLSSYIAQTCFSHKAELFSWVLQLLDASAGRKSKKKGKNRR